MEGGAGAGESKAATYTTHLRVLQVNDVYAEEAVRGRGGWSGLASLVRRYSSACAGHCVLVCCGDFLGGSATTTKHRGKNAVEVLNALDTYAVCVGNHEFDGGDDSLKQRMEESDFHWITGNVRSKETGELFGGCQDTRLLRLPSGNAAPSAPLTADMDCLTNDGLKLATPRDDESDVAIGFFGVCTAATPSLSYPSEDVDFVDPIKTAQAATTKLLEGHDGSGAADVVIGLTHLRLAQDKVVAREVSGVTALLGGHDHDPLVDQEGDCLIFKCGQNAYWLGVLDIRVDVVVDAGHRSVKTFTSFGMISNSNIAPDIGCPVEKIVRRYAKLMEDDEGAGDENPDEVLMTLFGTAELDTGSEAARRVALDTRTSLVRKSEAGFSNALADSMGWWFSAGPGLPSGEAPRRVIGIINGGFVRGDKTYPPGHQLTVRNIRKELPFPREVSLKKLRGQDIRQALEQMLVLVPAPSGGYPHLGRGARMQYDPTRPVGSRVTNLELHDKVIGIDNEDEFLVAITGFMAGGGDGADAYARGSLLSDPATSPRIADCFLEFVRRRPYGEISFEPQGRVVAV